MSGELRVPLFVTDAAGVVHKFTHHDPASRLNGSGEAPKAVTACGADCSRWPLIAGGGPTCRVCRIKIVEGAHATWHGREFGPQQFDLDFAMLVIDLLDGKGDGQAVVS